uniref:RNase H domain-containing protein n=1 Tax=Heligmosomoides polygyrus TaxID=6339 RepID=A0A183F6N2_HELPZ
LLIYTDFNCPSNFQQKLESYAKRDFYSFNGPKMKNAELLKELYECSKDVEVTFKHRPAVENKMPNYVMANILKGEKFAITSYPSSSGFKAASYATVWADKRYGNDTMHRLAMHPVTLFRAQLSAIEDALSQAVDNQLPKVLLVTDSRAFMLNWRKGWIKPNGSPAPNKFLYDRIKDLTQAGTEVCFRYEPQQKDSPEWSQAVEKCLEAIDLPMIGKDRSEYGRSVSDLLSDEPSLQNSCIPKVRIFKKGTNLPNGVVWNTENDQKIDDAKELDARIHRALLRVLEKASSMEMRELIIRTDSSRLISSTENWLPIWHRNGWRNSLHKHIADADSWKRIWQLKKTIKV